MIEIHHFDGQAVRAIPLDELRKLHPLRQGFVWVDLAAPTAEESRAVLVDLFHFHPLTVEDCGIFIDHPKIDEFEDYLFMAFHSLFYHEEEMRLAVWELDFFVGRNYLVTNHLKPIPYLPRIKEKFEKCTPNFVKGVDFLVAQILDTMVSAYYPVLTQINRKLDEVEREVMTVTDRHTITDIYKINRNLSIMRRVLLPQIEVLSEIMRYRERYFSGDSLIYFNDVTNHLQRIKSMVDSFVEMSEAAFNTNLAFSSMRMSVIMKRLTVITIIFMPLTFLSGVGGMSEWSMITGPDNWWYSYPIFLGGMAAIGYLTWRFLKSKGWT